MTENGTDLMKIEPDPLAVPETDTPVVAGPANVERARFLVRVLKIATPELGERAQAEKIGPGSKTWEQIADEFGCSVDTLDRAREDAGLKESRSSISAPADSDDHEPDEITNVDVIDVEPDSDTGWHEPDSLGSDLPSCSPNHITFVEAFKALKIGTVALMTCTELADKSERDKVRRQLEKGIRALDKLDKEFDNG